MSKGKARIKNNPLSPFSSVITNVLNRLRAGGTRSSGLYTPPNPSTLAYDHVGQWSVPSGADTLYITGKNFKNHDLPPVFDHVVRCVDFQVSRKVVFEGCNFWTSSSAVWGFPQDHEVEFHNCNFFGFNNGFPSHVLGRAYDKGGARRVVAKNCYVEGLGGFLTQHPQDGCVFILENNLFRNINGAANDGRFQQLQAGQIAFGNNVILDITGNVILNDQLASRPEDNFNFYDTKAPANRKGNVSNNLIVGALETPYKIFRLDGDPPEGYTGGGIMMEGAHNFEVKNNIIIRCNIYGISANRGVGNHFHHNTIINAGLVHSNGLVAPWANCAFYAAGGAVDNIIEFNKFAAVQWDVNWNLQMPLRQPRAHYTTHKRFRNDYGTMDAGNIKRDNLHLTAGGIWTNTEPFANGYLPTLADEESAINGFYTTNSDLVVGPIL